MKRFLFGFVWFILIWFGSLVVGGMVLGGIAGAKARSPEEGAVVGRAVGEEFGKRYGSVILWASALVAIGGSAAGILPGTKKEQS